MRRRMMMIAVAAAVGLMTGACADETAAGNDSGTVDATPDASDDAAGSDEAGEGAAVTIQSFIYSPTPLEVPVGTTVTWSNEDKILHTATSGTPDAPTDVFDVEMAEAGASGEFTFDEAGTYDYFCSRHNTMRGQVVVS